MARLGAPGTASCMSHQTMPGDGEHGGRDAEPRVEIRGADDHERADDHDDEEPKRLRLAAERDSASEDVDGQVHDDPHHVDEVPVDPADLDTVMVFRGEVPSERADRHEEQDREADEDVGAVQAR